MPFRTFIKIVEKLYCSTVLTVYHSGPIREEFSKTFDLVLQELSAEINRSSKFSALQTVDTPSLFICVFSALLKLVV